MLTAEKLASIDNDIETFRQCEHWAHMAMELRTDLFCYMSQPPMIDAGDPNNLPANLVKWVSWGETIADGLKKADAKIAELEARIASHVCAGPTTINLTENAAVQEYTAELRRELAEERNHVRQHKATIEAQGQSIESLREQIRQAQQEAAKSVAPGSAEWQRQVTAKFYKARKVLFGWAEQAKKNPSGVISLVSLDFESLVRELTSPERPGDDASETPAPDCEQLKADFMSARDSVAERLGRVKELLHTGPYDQVGREIEEALKELAGVSF